VRIENEIISRPVCGGLAERQTSAGAGIRNARACGKQIGRPRQTVDRQELRRLRTDGASLRQIAKKLGVGYGTLRHRLRDLKKTEK